MWNNKKKTRTFRECVFTLVPVYQYILLYNHKVNTILIKKNHSSMEHENWKHTYPRPIQKWWYVLVRVFFLSNFFQLIKNKMHCTIFSYSCFKSHIIFLMFVCTMQRNIYVQQVMLYLVLYYAYWQRPSPTIYFFIRKYI